MTPRDERVGDAAAGSAVLLEHALPELLALPRAERVERLAAHIAFTIRTCLDGRPGWPPAEPSAN